VSCLCERFKSSRQGVQQRMMQRSQSYSSNSRWWPARVERTRSSTSARREEHQKRSEICWSGDQHDGTPESVAGLSWAAVWAVGTLLVAGQIS